MVSRHSITFKVALHLAISSFILVLFLAAINTRFIQQQYILVEQDKLTSRMEDALSTLGINLSYEFYDAITETGNTLLLNENILFVKIKPHTVAEPFVFSRDGTVDMAKEFSKTMDITDPGTGESIGTFTVVYSRARYRQLMNIYYRYQVAILALYLIFIFFLIQSLLNRFRPLTKLADRMQDFAPEKKIQLLEYDQTNDEIAQIAEAANVMLQNIREYGNRLEQANIQLKASHDQLEKRVTERTEELKEKQLQLAHAGRLASLGELAAGIAHELGQPLQIINTAAEIIVSEIEDDTLNREEILPIAKKIAAQVVRSQLIIKNMRTFARYDRTKSANPIDVRIPLEECLSFFKEQFYQHQIILLVKQPEELPLVRTEFQKFQQIIVNLLSNARYAVDRKAVADTDFEKNVAIELLYVEDEQQVILEVRDNGIGMNEEEREHCLEPFYTTKAPGEGTGLGLSITYGILQEFHFTLDINSRRGEGSTFRITMAAEHPVAQA